MPCLSACSSGLLLTAALALLLLPPQHYVPELRPAPRAPAPARAAPSPPPVAARGAWPALQLAALPALDVLLTAALLALGALAYACEWLQRKLLERRVVKLNGYLGAGVERLRAWDAQQEQLEATLRMVQNATSEYNLLLYLLLRQHRCLRDAGAASDCFFDKEREDELHVLRGATLDA